MKQFKSQRNNRTKKSRIRKKEEEVAKKVGIGAVIFNDLSGSRIKR